MGEKSVMIRKVSVTDLESNMVPELKLNGLMVMIKDGARNTENWFIPIDRSYLRTVDALRVFSLINTSKYYKLIKKILECKSYEFMDQIVYIEHVPEPQSYVSFENNKYSLRTTP